MGSCPFRRPPALRHRTNWCRARLGNPFSSGRQQSSPSSSPSTATTLKLFVVVVVHYVARGLILFSVPVFFFVFFFVFVFVFFFIAGAGSASRISFPALRRFRR